VINRRLYKRKKSFSKHENQSTEIMQTKLQIGSRLRNMSTVSEANRTKSSSTAYNWIILENEERHEGIRKYI
jgi:hypothetical protein